MRYARLFAGGAHHILDMRPALAYAKVCPGPSPSLPERPLVRLQKKLLRSLRKTMWSSLRLPSQVGQLTHRLCSITPPTWSPKLSLMQALKLATESPIAPWIGGIALLMCVLTVQSRPQSRQHTGRTGREPEQLPVAWVVASVVLKLVAKVSW